MLTAWLLGLFALILMLVAYVIISFWPLILILFLLFIIMFAVGIEVHKSSNDTTIVREIGRNDPCPCGSGKKYKKCCGSLDLSRNIDSTNSDSSNIDKW